MLKIAMAEALVLSEALSQYVENSLVGDVDADDPRLPIESAKVAVAERMLDDVNTLIARAAA